MKPEEYRKKNIVIFDVEAPGGIFKMRRPSLTELIRQGKIPTAMYKFAMKISGLEGEVALDETNPEHVKAIIEFMAFYICAASIEPKFVMTEKEIDSEDKFLIDSLHEENLFPLFHATFNRKGGTGLNSGTFSEKSGSGTPGRSGAAV